MADSRTVARKAGSAAIERALESLMPALNDRLARIDERIAGLTDQIDQRIKGLQDQIRSVEGQVVALREDMLDRYERQLNLINEVNNRMVRLEGKMEGYMEAMRVFQPVKQGSKRRAG